MTNTMKGIEITEGVVITPETTAKEVANFITQTWMTEYHLISLIRLYGHFQAKRENDAIVDIIMKRINP